MLISGKRMLFSRSLIVLLAVMLLIPLLPTSVAMADEPNPTPNECDAMQSAWLFCDDFEQDRLSSYYLNTKPGTFARSGGNGIDGSTSMSANFNSASRPGDLALAFGKTPDNGAYQPVGDPDEVVREFYWRFYVQNDETWTNGLNGDLARVFAYGPDDQIIAQISVNINGGDIQTAIRTATFDVNGAPNGSQSAGNAFLDYPFMKLDSVGTWNSLEVHVKLNDPGQSNGLYELWLNGRVMAKWENVNWLGSYEDYGFNVIQLQNYNNAGSSTYRHFDNMVLSQDKVEPYLPEINRDRDAPAQVLFEDDFDGYTDTPSNHGWGASSAISIDPTGGVDGSHAAKVTITGEGTRPLSRNVARDNISQVYVKFDFRMDNPSGGIKFLKLFGRHIEPNANFGYANATFGLNYWQNWLQDIQYGNGNTSLNNDSNNIIYYQGNHNDPEVVVDHSSQPFDPKDGQWHTYEAFMRYNTVGNRDGEFMVLIDGVPTLHATNVKNHHDLNSGEFNKVNLADYTSAQYNGTPWHLWYDNVVIMDNVPADVLQKFETYVDPTQLIVNECNLMQPDWIFCDDYEENRLSQYYDYFNRWGRFLIKTTGMESSKAMTSYYGHYAGDPVTDPHGTWMKLAFGKTPDAAAYKPKGDPDEINRELYWRFYVRNNTEATGDTPINNGPLARVYGYGPDNTPIMSINLHYPDASGKLNSQLYTGQFDGSGNPTGVALSDELAGTKPVMHTDSAGEWHRIEVHAKLNDPGQANGVYELWIDGELESSKSGIDWVGNYADYGINAVEIYNTNNQAGVPGGNNEYHAFDNMVLSRSFIGEAGQPVTNNANLGGLKQSVGKLVPAFQPTVTAYELVLEDGVTSVDLTPVLSDSQATLKVDGATHASNIAYAVNGTQTSIEVTAPDRVTKRTYTIEVVHEEPFLVNECASPQAGWLFCDDFEADRMDQYFEHSRASQFYRTEVVGLGGSSGMKAEFREADGEQHDTGTLKLAFGRTPSSYMTPVAAQGEDLEEMYVRFYVKNEEGWTGGGGDKLARISSMQTANWAQSMIAHAWSGGSGGQFLTAAPASGTDAAGVLKSTKWNDFDNLRWMNGNTSATPIFDANHVGEWYAVETHVKLNDPGQSNGIFELWIDDKLEASAYDLNWIGNYEIGPGAGYGLNWVALENYWNNGTPQDQERYFDNLVVSREKIGLAEAEQGPASGVIAGSDSPLTAGGNADLTIGVVNPGDGFTTLQAVVNYDPAKLQFATNGTALAESAIESLRANFSVIGTAIKPELGQIMVMMASTGQDNAVNESSDLFRLHGQVKSDAAIGSTTVSLSQFDVAMNGTNVALDVSQASDALTIEEEIVEANKEALTAAIAAAQAKYNAAPEGTKLGQYPAAARSAMLSAIGAATAVHTNTSASQVEVDQAVIDLNAAVQALKASIITLVEGATSITIADLSVIAQYYGLSSADAAWGDIEAADVLHNGVIDIRTLAAIAQMILDDWLQQ